MNSVIRICATGCFALAGAGVCAVAPVTPPPSAIQVRDIQLTAGDEPDIILDFVRHAQTNPPGSVVAVATQGLPGFPLSDTGRQQAVDVGNQLFAELGGPNGVAGIYGGQEQRMIETITPFDQHEDMTMQAVGGFNEIGGGIYSDAPPGSIGEYLAILPVLSWVFGDYFAWMPGSNDYNGAQFEENFGGAVAAMYNNTVTDVADPVVSANGHITDIAVSGEGAIAAWVLMNVNNPDLAIFLPLALNALSTGDLINTAGQVVVEGNPGDGWTLVSWDGQAIPQDPGLLTDLFVDQRALETAPQLAAWNIFQAAVNGNSASLANALQEGMQNMGAALTRYPTAVVDDITSAVQSLGAAVAGGESFTDAFDSVILGLPLG